MKSTGNPILPRKVGAFLASLSNLEGTSILVAFSGGPDSTACLFGLRELACEYGIRVRAAYFDHGIRPAEERAEERTRVERLCGDSGIEVIAGGAEAGWITREAKEKGTGIEDCARNHRYRFLRSAMVETKSDRIAFGHTQDDQVETLVMRFFQGSGPGGLAGMTPERGIYLRPLLSCTKDEVYSYLAARNLPYTIDSTNLADTYLRNRIRLSLVPEIARIFPGYRTSLASAAEKMELAQRAVGSYRVEWKKSDRGLETEYEAFTAMPAASRIEVLLALYDEAAEGSSSRIPYRFFKPLVGNLPETDSWILKGYGFGLRREGSVLVWAPCIASPSKKGYFIKGKNRVELEKGQIAVHPRGGVWFVVRSRTEGDTVRVRGIKKCLKDVFSEFDPAVRDEIPVVETRNGVVAVVGCFHGYRNIASDGTSIEMTESGNLVMIVE